MVFDSSVLRNEEKIIFALRSLFGRSGYSQYKMSKFEEYDFYARNKDFLVSDHIMTFNDTNGKLMAMKPDVTLSIIKSTKDEPGLVQRLYYSENVYRDSEDSNGFREINQTGIECIGDLAAGDICSVVRLAAESLMTISADSVLEISNLNIVSSVIDSLNLSASDKELLIKGINEKNTGIIDTVCAGNAAGGAANALKELAFTFCPACEAGERLRKISEDNGLGSNTAFAEAVCELESLITAIGQEWLPMIKVDFSISSDLKYYNNIVFSGFINGIPKAVLSGGQYDRLMKKVKRTSRAVGFAVYMDALERLGDIEEESALQGKGAQPAFTSNIIAAPENNFINVALPKGRLGEKVYDMFARAGFECPSILENNRKLIFENKETRVRYFWAKPSDVAIYVERGAADIGVAGKDIILEHMPDVYELLDLNIGKCRMCVAAPTGYRDNPQQTLRVATKFQNIARSYYASVGRDIDIISLNGSIEIAPIIDLSDVIVDIVETGTTLKENNLEVITEIVPISARLIANKASYKFNSELIMKIQGQLSQMVREGK